MGKAQTTGNSAPSPNPQTTKVEVWDGLEIWLELTWPRLLPQIPVIPETPNLFLQTAPFPSE